MAVFPEWCVPVGACQVVRARWCVPDGASPVVRPLSRVP